MFRRNRAAMIAWSRSWGRKSSLRRWKNLWEPGLQLAGDHESCVAGEGRRSLHRDDRDDDHGEHHF